MKLPRSMHKNKGFVIIWILLFLPLMMTVIYSAFAEHRSIHTILRTQDICRKKAMDFQARQVQLLNQLLALNHEAQLLQHQHRIYKAQLAWSLATVNPAALAQAKLQILRIESSQRLLNQMQQQIILAIRKNEVIAISSIRNALKATTSEFTQIQITDYKRPSIPIHPTSDSIAPEYELKKTLIHDAALALKWNGAISTKQHTSNYISYKGNLEGTCGATITQKDKQVQADLYAAKF